jgi:thiol-disulfide isomerase/thioredoxin
MTGREAPVGDSSKSNGQEANASGGLSNALIVLILVAIVMVLVVRVVRPRDEQLQIQLPPLSVAGWLNTDDPPADGQLRGRVVLIDCWASWCGSCVEGMPQVVKVYERYHDQGLLVIGLTPESGDELDAVKDYVASVPGLDWPIGYGAQMPFAIMGIEAIPMFVLFDKSGKSVWAGHTFAGFDDAAIAALAAEG